MTSPFDRLARHLEVERAVIASGGRIVASFDLDEHGRTVGDDTRERIHHCAECGERGHNALRCNGEGQPPKPTHRVRRKIEQLRRRADRDLEAAKAEIARRLEAKAKR